MSTAGISSSSLIQGAQYFQDRKSDLQQLGQALQSGNLKGAQQDFATITNLGQNGPFAGGNAFAVTARQQDFTAIGQALQSGDIAGAQQALAQLQSTFKSGQGSGPAAGGNVAQNPGLEIIINISAPAVAGATSPAITTNAASTSPVQTATPPASTAVGPEIVLNLGNGTAGGSPEEITLSFNNTSSGEQLTVGVGTQQNPNAQELVLNLAQNSNEEIILNLGALSSATTSRTSSTGTTFTATGGTSSTGATGSTTATGTATGSTVTSGTAPASGLNVVA